MSDFERKKRITLENVADVTAVVVCSLGTLALTLLLLLIVRYCWHFLFLEI